MSTTAKRNRVKGFTLIEMIIVIAILGILVGILTPSMMSYYRSSRIKEANTNAKMVYNAAQTEVMRYISSDRSLVNKSGFQGGLWISYTPDGTVSYFEGPNPPSSPSSMTAATASSTDIVPHSVFSVANRVNRVVSGADQYCWSVYVNNYIVLSCTSAKSAGTSNVGYYSANKQSAPTSGQHDTYEAAFLTQLTSLTSGYALSGVTDSSVAAGKPKTESTNAPAGSGNTPGGSGNTPGGPGNTPGGPAKIGGGIEGSASAAHMGQNGQ